MSDGNEEGPFSDFRCSRGTMQRYEEQTAGIRERTVYQHDKGDITYSRAFRRLAYKSHLVTKKGVHCRTKLLHSLEVAIIASEISSLLGLDVDLTEAICFGHDVGSYPFGYIGEGVVKSRLGYDWSKELAHPLRGYSVLWEENQVRRSADPDRYERLFESGCYPSSRTPSGEDYLVTISKETLDGVRYHQPEDFRYASPPQTVEAQVVRFADNFAYITQELSDAYELGVDLIGHQCRKTLICSENGLSPLPSRIESSLKSQYSWAELKEESMEFCIDASDVFSASTGKRLNAMIYWLVGYNKAEVGALGTYRSNILKKEIPLLEYPKGLSFIIDYIWYEVIGRELHQNSLVAHNFKLASQMVGILFDNLIELGPQGGSRYEEILRDTIGYAGPPTARQLRIATAKYISEMTDLDLEKAFSELWDLF